MLVFAITRMPLTGKLTDERTREYCRIYWNIQTSKILIALYKLFLILPKRNKKVKYILNFLDYDVTVCNHSAQFLGKYFTL